MAVKGGSRIQDIFNIKEICCIANICLVLLGTGCTHLRNANSQQPAKTEHTSVRNTLLKPEVEYTGEQPSQGLKRKLKRTLKQQFQTFQRANLPTSVSQQTTAYREALERTLLSEGYYQHKVQLAKTRDSAGKKSKQSKDQTTQYWTVQTSQQYKIGKITLSPTPDDFAFQNSFPKNFHIDAPLLASTILQAKESLSDALAQHRCLWRIEVDYEIQLDHVQHKGDVFFKIAPAPSATFGTVTLSGTETVPIDYLKAQIPPMTGKCFKRSDVRHARLKLLNTGLLSQVDAQLTHHRTLGIVDVQLTVKERLHRSVSTSIGYSIDEKGALSAGWVNRNFREQANRLSVYGRYSSLLQSAEFQWTQPHVFGPKQNLNWQLSAENEQIDAFDARNRLFAVRSEHQITPYLLGNIGLEIGRRHVVENDIGKQFELISLPLGLTYDRRDDILNPLRGSLSFVNAETFWSLHSNDAHFQKLSFGHHHYYSRAYNQQPLTLATRLFFAGFTQKENTQIIPATEQFFSGGGGSVRGFAYKSLGPRSPNDNATAIGGFSMLELSIELRYRLTQSWGIVLFADAGNAWLSRTPDLDASLPQSAGIGARFFTGFVPVRLDVAFPTHRPKNFTEPLTDTYQLYISIGQAF